jgi:hypothetical protein
MARHFQSGQRAAESDLDVIDDGLRIGTKGQGGGNAGGSQQRSPCEWTMSHSALLW